MASLDKDATVTSATMKYRYLGGSGLLVSELALGCWVTFEDHSALEALFALFKHAFERGVTLFDNAESYGGGRSEELMGRVVQRGIAENVWTREALVLTTKIFFGSNGKTGPNDQGLSRKHLIEGIKASLKRMQLAYVDMLYCHRSEPFTPIEEVVRAMSFIIKQGWALYWGTSEWSSYEIIQACEIADRLKLARPVVEQPQYHLLERTKVEFDYVNLYTKYQLGLTTWSPLAYRILSGKYTAGIPATGSRLSDPEVLALVPNLTWRVTQAEKLKAVALKCGVSLPQLAIVWCLSNKNVSSVILGASSVEQLDENLNATKLVPMISDELKREIDGIVQFTPSLPVTPAAVAMLRAKHLGY